MWILSKTHCALLYIALLTVCGCATVPDTAGQNPSDPYESWNRHTFEFNDTLDKYLLKPVATGYQQYVPQLARTGVGNFFSNLSDVTNALNGVLQLDAKTTITSTTRFLLNSTFGLFGLIDLATNSGLRQTTTSLSITLNKYGVGSGPYLVLPFLGPSDVRSTISFWPESYYLRINGNGAPVSSQTLRTYQWHATVLNAVDTRARFLNAESFIVGDKYNFLRNVYIQRRNNQERKSGQPIFGNSDNIEAGRPTADQDESAHPEDEDAEDAEDAEEDEDEENLDTF